MITVIINAHGETESDVLLAIEEARKRIEAGNVGGVDDNESGGFSFAVDGFEATSQPTGPDLAGVFWAGDGYEVQRSDESDRFPGDMEAAIHVATATDCRWLLYVQGEEGDDTSWQVYASSSRDWVRGELEDYESGLYGDDLHAFCFDGRLGLDALEDGPNGIGYRLKTP